MAASDVERWLVVAEKRDPRVRNPGEEKAGSWVDRHVTDAGQRAALKLWVWCRAHGYAFDPVCRSRGLSTTTMNRRRAAAVERIAMLLNLEASLVRDSNLVAAVG